jgi:SAM-dependent methyltransferase
MPDDSFWNDPATVEQFASLAPDQQLVEGIVAQAASTVLDLGAASGRNTECPARAGYRVAAIDTAPAMLSRVRARCAGLRPAPLAVLASMAALPLANGSLDGVVSIGVYQQAQGDAELLAAMAETRRVLRPGGWLLISVFAVAMLPPGAMRAAGQRYLHHADGRTVCRLSIEDLVGVCGASRLNPDGDILIRPGPLQSQRVTLVGWFRAG